jgi:hypothetical protein
MMQTFEAVIDMQGRVSLLENIKLTAEHRALVTILDNEKSKPEEMILFGSMELIDEDLEGASRQISEMINQAIEKSAEGLGK